MCENISRQVSKKEYLITYPNTEYYELLNNNALFMLESHLINFNNTKTPKKYFRSLHVRQHYQHKHQCSHQIFGEAPIYWPYNTWILVTTPGQINLFATSTTPMGVNTKIISTSHSWATNTMAQWKKRITFLNEFHYKTPAKIKRTWIKNVIITKQYHAIPKH